MRVVVFEVRQSIPSKGAHVPFKPWGNHERERTWSGSNPSILARLLKAANLRQHRGWRWPGCALPGIWPWKVNALLIEKETWPRDKICGDAVGGKSLSHVKRLGVKETLESTPHFRVTGIVFSSPKGHSVRVALPEEDVQRLEAGYSLPRQQFDHLLFNQVQQLVRDAGGAVLQGGDVRDVLYDDGNGGDDPGKGSGEQRHARGVVVRVGGRKGEEMVFHAPNVVGAAGYRCPVAKSMLEETYEEPMVDRSHYCAGYREYWRGVKGCEDNVGDIEIHFVDTIIPGYFWLFPVAECVVNVGIGMVMSLLDKQSKKLKALQAEVIAEHPLFKDRFAEASMVQERGRGGNFRLVHRGKSQQPTSPLSKQGNLPRGRRCILGRPVQRRRCGQCARER